MKTFSIKESIKISWEIVKKNFWFVVGTTFVYLILNSNFSGGNNERDWQWPDYPVVTLVLIGAAVLLLVVCFWAIRTIVQIGYYRIYLGLLSGHKAPFLELFTHRHPFWRYVGSMILYALRVLVGFLLLIVPGIIWAIKFQFMPVLTVDKGLRPLEAMNESARMTEGHKWHLFKFGLVVLGINILGFLCFFVGILVTVPLTTLAFLHVYKALLRDDAIVA